MKQPYVQMQHVSKSFGEKHVLKNIQLDIQKGEFISIVGKSGCGKSTILRLVAGLEKPKEGNIMINKMKVKGIPEDVRIMFQNGRLLPWKTVLQNVGLGLGGDWQELALKALQNVYLEDRKDEWPSVLSGGQQQRVSLARALVHSPSLLLLDEPLGALDALTRLEMQRLIEQLWLRKSFTAILVTHDIEEAVALSDRIILIEDGKIHLDYKVNLPRPRSRTNTAFTKILDTILNRVLEHNQLDNQVGNKQVTS
ncbi:ATP-binding cassette domain-containing protein [Halalkalibacter alkalisediminis]|uniref:ATP-binding cassette domain-containing protein n=1 Tax=Halalkalibacter alkalisediminis TaxID=935616 RepID=A0ABV6NDN9_9BACI|nr:ATP-binding cassette domain-containing protein [Halalkalibacter alkalisediminis]